MILIENLGCPAQTKGMKRKIIPIRTILTNRRDSESDLGGVQLVERKTSEDRAAAPVRNDDKSC